jgi:hypothetical protein
VKAPDFVALRRVVGDDAAAEGAAEVVAIAQDGAFLVRRNADVDPPAVVDRRAGRDRIRVRVDALLPLERPGPRVERVEEAGDVAKEEHAVGVGSGAAR